MNVRVRLYPPLNNAAGQSQVEFALDADATIQVLIDRLVERFGDEVHRFLFDNQGRIIPAWCAFINQSAAGPFQSTRSHEYSPCRWR